MSFENIGTTEQKKNTLSLFAMALALYFAIIVFDVFVIGSVGTLLKLMGVVIIGVWVFYFSKISFRLDVTLICEICFLLICFASVMYSIDVEETKAALKAVALNFGLIIVCTSFVFNKREVGFIEKALVVGSSVVALAAFVFSDISAHYGRLSIRIMGETADPNYINGYLIFALSFFIYHLINTKKFKLLCLAAAGGIIIFTLLTGSRGALLTQAAVIVAVWFFSVRNKDDKIKLMIGGALMAVFLVVFFFYIVSVMPEEIAERFSLDFIREGGTTGRFELWDALLTRYIKDDAFTILFGTGIGTAPAYNTLKPDVAHNVFIDVLIGTGIFGLIFYVGIFVSLFIKALKSKNVIGLGALVGVTVLSLSLTTYFFKPMFNIFLYVELYHRYYCTQITAIGGNEAMQSKGALKSN